MPRSRELNGWRPSRTRRRRRGAVASATSPERRPRYGSPGCPQGASLRCPGMIPPAATGDPRDPAPGALPLRENAPSPPGSGPNAPPGGAADDGDGADQAELPLPGAGVPITFNVFSRRVGTESGGTPAPVVDDSAELPADDPDDLENWGYWTPAGLSEAGIALLAQERAAQAGSYAAFPPGPDCIPGGVWAQLVRLSTRDGGRVAPFYRPRLEGPGQLMQNRGAGPGATRGSCGRRECRP